MRIKRPTFNNRSAHNKFNARKTNGFSSALEAAVYDILKLREKAGEITDIRCQHTVVLQDGPRETSIRWKVDFSFLEGGELTFCEAKGVETETYKLKLKMFRKNPPGKLYIYKGHFRNPKVTEIINRIERHEEVLCNHACPRCCA